MENWKQQPCQDPPVSPTEEAPPGTPGAPRQEASTTPHEIQVHPAPLMFISISNMFLGLSLVALKNPYFLHTIKALIEQAQSLLGETKYPLILK